MLIEQEKIDENLLRCPRCNKPRTMISSAKGYLGIKPSIEHVVRYLKCENPKCSYKKQSYLVTEIEKQRPVEDEIQSEYDQLLADFS